MEKFNWKSELKKSFKGFWYELWLSLCLALALAFVVFTQTEKQFQSIVTLIFEKDWSMIAVLFIGIVYMGAGVEKILKGIWWIIKFIGRYMGWYTKEYFQ